MSVTTEGNISKRMDIFSTLCYTKQSEVCQDQNEMNCIFTTYKEDLD